MKKISWINWAVLALLVLSSSCSKVIFKKMYGGRTEQLDSSLYLPQGEEIIVIQHVNILSPNADSILEDKTLLIKKGKIDRIGEDLPIPEKSVVIDGTGKYLIPGLIDAHIHLFQSPNDLFLYIANGVTSIRELKGSDHHLEWREEINSGKRLGPNLFVATTKFQSKGFFSGIFLHYTQGDEILNKPKKAKNILRKLKTKGYDAIKIGTFLNEETYNVVNIAAKELEMSVVGHIPLNMPMDRLWTSNQTDVVHIEEFVKHFNREFGYVKDQNKEEFLAFVEKRGEEVAQKLVESEIVVTTTLWLTESFIRLKSQMHETLESVQLEYVNPGLVEGTFLTSRALGWLPKVNPYRLPSKLTEEQKINHLAYFDTYAKANQILLRIFNENGVTLMAGTDTNLPVLVPGFALHDELLSMQQAGMTPSQILRAATTVPAEWMNLNSGKIEEGFQAELVLLNQNPLENIANTKSIETVILRDKIIN